MDSVDGAHAITRVSEVTNISRPDAQLQILGNEIHLPAGVDAQAGRNDGVSPSHGSASSPLLELKVPQITIDPVVVARELSAELGGNRFGIRYSNSAISRGLNCCRSMEERDSDAGIEFQSPIFSFSWRKGASYRGFSKDYKPGSGYIVVGIKGSNSNIPKEKMISVLMKESDDPKDDRCLFKAINRGVRSVRPYYRDVLSLKSVSGFGIYQCFPTEGYHDTVEIGPKTTKTLALLFNDYTSKKRHGINRQWLDWIHDEFNCSSEIPEHGKYALELVLKWSATKFIVWGLSPVLLSLVIGFWYMLKPLKDGEDPVAVVQTAWTISSFVVTAAAVLLGVLAAITQFGHV